MNNDSRCRPSLRQPWRTRTAAVTTVIAGTALLAAACSDNPSSTRAGSTTASGSANSSSGIAYSQCMRSHGVPGFPDPDAGGQIPKPAAVQALRQVSDSRANAASGACANLNPAGQGTPALTAQQEQDYLRAAACMRSHGITSFPDPTFSGGHVRVNIPTSLDTNSPQFTQAAHTCARLIPHGLPYSQSGG